MLNSWEYYTLCRLNVRIVLSTTTGKNARFQSCAKKEGNAKTCKSSTGKIGLKKISESQNPVLKAN